MGAKMRRDKIQLRRSATPFDGSPIGAARDFHPSTSAERPMGENRSFSDTLILTQRARKREINIFTKRLFCERWRAARGLPGNLARQHTISREQFESRGAPMNWLSRIADTFGGIINEGRELGDSAVRYSAILARFDEANDVMEGFAAQAKLDGKLELARRVEAELTGLALKAHEAFAAYRSTVNGLLPQSFKMDPGHDGLRPMLNPEYALQVSEQSAHSSNPKAVINAFLDLVETLERAWLHSLNYFRKQTGAS